MSTLPKIITIFPATRHFIQHPGVVRAGQYGVFYCISAGVAMVAIACYCGYCGYGGDGAIGAKITGYGESLEWYRALKYVLSDYIDRPL